MGSSYDTDWDRASAFHQVGIAVFDLDIAIAELGSTLGVPSDAWDRFDTRPEGFRHSEPQMGTVVAQTRYARAMSGATVYQLVEPLTAGTIWDRSRRAESPIFAVGYFVRDIPARTADLQRTDAATVLATGRIREGPQTFDYSFLHLPGAGLTVELMGTNGVARSDRRSAHQITAHAKPRIGRDLT